MARSGELGAQLAESRLREQILRETGVSVPSSCPGCGTLLHVKRTRAGVVATCEGRCDRPDTRSALEHLRAGDAPSLPGF